MASEVTPHRGYTLSSILGFFAILAFIAAVLVTIAINLGWYTPEWLQTLVGPAPAATVRALPADAPRATYAPAVQQAQPTVAPATALPEGIVPGPAAPAVQSDPAVPAPVVGPNPDAPAEIKTRAPVCFAGWWYVEGQNTGISCSGTGGD